MGVGKLNVWVSDKANACGTWRGEGALTVLDCRGILEWPCGRYLTPEGDWGPVPGGRYQNLPFRCGHLEVEVPPGCYWVVAGNVRGGNGAIGLNDTTHVGIVEVGCDETACVKLYNPTLLLCWTWFRTGLHMHTVPSSEAPLDPEKVKRVEELVEELLKDLELPRLPGEKVLEKVFRELVESAGA